MMLILIGFAQKPMAAPQVIPPLQIDDFQLQITHMKRDGHTQPGAHLAKEQRDSYQHYNSVTRPTRQNAWG
jgi:hypothetical protein